jgi:hypothetical protein
MNFHETFTKASDLLFSLYKLFVKIRLLVMMKSQNY